MRCLGGGSTTFKSKPKAKGLEPDECYYFGSHATPEFRKGKRSSKLQVPDLALEVDYTSRSIPRLPIYAGLGVPEVWRLQGDQLHCLHLTKSGEYEESKFSLAFPMLRPADLTRFIQMAEQSCDQTSTVKAFRKWVRKQGWAK
jgi:Uma2 family endonuclease